MSRERVERRLAAILAADVAGYSRLIGADEEGTLARLRVIRRELTDPKIAEHRGRIVKTTGDGLLIEFTSVVNALRCAVEVQEAMHDKNAGVLPAECIEFRVGIHQGDIVVEDDDIFGDGVNVAARLEGIAEPGGICVSARVQEDAAGRLGLDFEDIGEQALKNIARPVRAYRVRFGPAASGTPAVLSVPLALPDKPSIAVLPFQNMSGDLEQEYFADGMVEEIITALSRIRWLFVIARNSSFTYKGQAVDVKRVGRELGVRYVLEGSVRKGGNRVRITAQLIEAETGAHLWADRFDGALEDVFDLQDQVASNVAGVIEPALEAAEMRRSTTRPTTDLSAYDLYMRGLAAYPPRTKDKLSEALALFEKAAEIDPDFGLALSWAGICYMRLVYDGWAEDPALCQRNAVSFSHRALEVAESNPGVLANAAFVLTMSGEDINANLELIRRALFLNPNFARGWYLSGFIHVFAGQHDIAIRHFETSCRLSPRERIGLCSYGLGLACFFIRQFEKAVSHLLISIQENPGAPISYRCLAAAYAHAGRIEEAREIIRQLRKITDLIIHDVEHYRNPADRELYVLGLRLALEGE